MPVCPALCPQTRQQPASCSAHQPARSAAPWRPSHTPSLPARRRAPLLPRAAAAGGQPPQPGDADRFTYQSAEVAARLAAERAQAREDGMAQYEALKDQLRRRTWRFGGLFAGYLLLSVSGESAACELLGCAAGYGYLLWLMRDADSLSPESRLPLAEARAIEQPVVRAAASLVAAYRYALGPRLLVLPSLLGVLAAVSALAGPTVDGQPALGLVEQGCAVGGFLSYKVALLLKLYDDLKPRPLTEEEMLRQSAPRLPEVDDVPTDIYGRPLREANPVVAAAEEAEAAEGGGGKPGKAGGQGRGR